MPKLWSIVVLIALGTFPQAVSPGDLCIIRGVVKSGLTEALPQANVHLLEFGREVRTTVTDRTGTFAFLDVKPSSYTVCADHPTYIRSCFGQTDGHRTSSLLLLRPGQVQNIDVMLPKPGVIAGRVTDRRLEPVQDVPVQVLTSSYSNGKRILTVFPTKQPAVTDADGAYRVSDLPAGEYIVRAAYRQHRPEAKPGGGNTPAALGPYLQTYYPMTVDVRSSPVLHLSEGMQLSPIDIQLAPHETFNIRGTLSGGPLEPKNLVVRYYLLPVDDPTEWNAPTTYKNFSTDGGIDLRGIAPGTYEFCALGIDNRKIFAGIRTIQITDHDLADVDVSLDATPEVKGMIRFVGSSQEPKAPGVAVRLISLGIVPPSLQPPPAFLKADGTFNFGWGVAPGLYRIVLATRPEVTLSSAALDGVPISGDGLVTISPNSAFLQLDLVRSTILVQGSVVDANQHAIAHAKVVLIPQAEYRQRSDLYRTTETNEQGNFWLRGVRPGSYKAFAWEDRPWQAYEDPEFMAQVEPRGVTVQVAPPSVANLRITVIPR